MRLGVVSRCDRKPNRSELFADKGREGGFASCELLCCCFSPRRVSSYTGREINVAHDETKMLFMFSLFLSRLPTQFSLWITLFLMLYWCRCYASYTSLSSYTDISDERSLSLRLKIESDGMEKFSCSRKWIFFSYFKVEVKHFASPINTVNYLFGCR